MKKALWFFQHKLLNKSPRNLLKDDTIPTIFDYKKDKQPSRCKTNCAQLEIVNKKQLCEEAFDHYDQWRNFDMEINRSAQTNQEMTGIGTQTDILHLVFSLITKDQSTQFNGIRESVLETE